MAIGKREVAKAALEQIPGLCTVIFTQRFLRRLILVGLLDRPNVESIHAVGGQMSAAAAEARKASMRLAKRRD